MKKLKIISKKIKEVYIGNGLYVVKVGYDFNYNPVVSVVKLKGHWKNIPLNTQNITDAQNILKLGVEYFVDNRNPEVKKSIDQIKEYYKKNLE